MLGISLEKSNATPLVAVRRPGKGPRGQQNGTITTNPDEIDEIVRKQYGRIYAGNVKVQRKVVEKYKKNYAKYIYKAPKATMEPLTGHDLEQVAKHAKETAGGMGGHQRTSSSFRKQLLTS